MRGQTFDALGEGFRRSFGFLRCRDWAFYERAQISNKLEGGVDHGAVDGVIHGAAGFGHAGKRAQGVVEFLVFGVLVVIIIISRRTGFSAHAGKHNRAFVDLHIDSSK